jgi:murein DD-endopeptidase MepM/ murein hydrolase activator NlpD
MTSRSFLFVVLICICLGPAFVAADLIVDEKCVTGGYIKVTMGYHHEAIWGELRDLEGTVLSRNLLFDLPGSSKSSLATVLGVPESLKQGSYSVAITDRNGDVLYSRMILMQSREFRKETIQLNRPLTQLRRSESSRRIVEAKKLTDLINTQNREARYHFGVFRVPVHDGRITSYFGDRRLYAYADARSDTSVHMGLDLAAPEGTPVKSSGNGIVVFSGERLISGNTVVIEHLPGVFSLYFHLAELSVEAGDLVEENEIIGSIGSTGLATGPHLHWEMRIGGIGVDPQLMTSFSF